MFTKTDLAKFENVWDDHPKYVNLGAQKNFSQYARRIGKEWEKSSEEFNEFYFKRAVSRGLIFRATERLVSSQPWYNGGYRANIVAYTLAALSEIAKSRNLHLDFVRIWNEQGVDNDLEGVLSIIAEEINKDIIHPPGGISNISEWCKKDACWSRIQSRLKNIDECLPSHFFSQLLTSNEQSSLNRSARKTQRVDDGIETQRKIISIPADKWGHLYQVLLEKALLTPKEIGVLKIAMQIPARVPSERQCAVLVDILEKGKAEGILKE